MLGIFDQLKSYLVYVKPDTPDPLESAEFIKEGFSFYAFFLWPFWSLYHRIWWLFALYIVVTIMFVVLLQYQLITDEGNILLQSIISAFVGFNASDWRAEALEKRGYILYSIATGTHLLHAEQRFLDRYVPPTTNSTEHAITT